MIQFFNKKMSNKRRGFTLIELVVVIAILGILAAIAIPRLSRSREGAADSANQANLRTIESAIGLYQAEHGVLPNDIALLTSDYLKENPSDPYTNDPAGYEVVWDTTAETYVADRIAE